MKVKELIIELQEYPQDADVVSVDSGLSLTSTNEETMGTIYRIQEIKKGKKLTHWDKVGATIEI